MYSQFDGKCKTFKRLTTSFQGVVLDDFLTDDSCLFKTIKVSGREASDEDHLEQKIPGRNGSYFLSSTKKPKQIEVLCVLEARDKKALNSAFTRLHFQLTTQHLEPLAFSDDIGYHFMAKYQSLGIPDISKDSAVFTIVFVCYKPFKYSDFKDGTGMALRYEGHIPSSPKLTMTLTSSGTELRVLHVQQQKYIRLVGQFTRGQIVHIDTEKKLITLNQKSIMDKLDVVNSRFFTLPRGDNTITCNLSNHIAIQYREVMLC